MTELWQWWKKVSEQEGFLMRLAITVAIISFFGSWAISVFLDFINLKGI